MSKTPEATDAQATQRAWIVHDRDDLHVTIRFALSGDHWADFELYEIVAWPVEVTPDGPKRYFQRRGESCAFDHVESVDDAKVYATGFIKWDGCCEFGFSDKDREHFCGRDDAERFGKMLVAIWDIAATIVPAWSHESAGTEVPR